MVKIEKAFRKKYSSMNYENSFASKDNFRGAYMVMQLHDEVIYEVCKQDLADVQAIVKDCMENCMELPVKMKIKMKTGTSWGSLTNVV
jgi:DNA polymerase I-like protein with 3'-5' exonuclease and polymerase domains